MPEQSDDEAFDAFVKHVRENTVRQMDQSAYVVSLIPGEVDVKFAVELGLAIMLDKPIMFVAQRNEDIPPKLLPIADMIVVADVDTEEGRDKLREAMERMRERLE